MQCIACISVVSSVVRVCNCRACATTAGQPLDAFVPRPLCSLLVWTNTRARPYKGIQYVARETNDSPVTAEFDAACVADTAYAARVARGDRPITDDDKTTLDELQTRDGRLFTRGDGRGFTTRTGALYVPRNEALRTRLIRECHDSATVTGG